MAKRRPAAKYLIVGDTKTGIRKSIEVTATTAGNASKAARKLGVKPMSVKRLEQNPRVSKLPVGKKIKVNWVKQNRDGSVTMSVASRVKVGAKAKGKKRK